MQVLKRKIEPLVEKPQAAELMAAFESFNRASRRLERRYKQLQIETESLREQLRIKELEVKRSERLAVLGETAAGIAHEVRNPLGAIKLFASLLKRDLTDQPSAQGLVVEIERSVTALENVVSNILQFSKEGAVPHSPVNLHSVIRQQAARLTAAEREVVLDLNLQGNPYISGDEHSLGQVFYNLILNGIQAIKSSGRIAIESVDYEQGVRVSIGDSGPGIDPEILERIFDPFVTTKGNGTGLGLAIVRKIVSRHGGTICAANQGGAKFTLLLPRKAGEMPKRGE